MPTNNLKLIALVLVTLVFLACARSKPLTLPPSPIGDSNTEGWKNY